MSYLVAGLVLVACGGQGGPDRSLISEIEDQSTTLGEPLEVAFDLAHGSPEEVTTTASSTSTDLVANRDLTISGTGAERVLRLQPSAKSSGSTTITVRASDAAGGEAAESFQLDVTPPFQSAMALETPDANADSQFGWSVAVDGDTLIVGSIRGTGTHPESGAAYVYENVEGQWELVQALAASDGRPDHSFGYAVDIDGDKAIIGAYADDHYGSYSGAAYIFQRGPDGWTEVAKLLASDGEANDRLGGDVAISGGIAILGATGDDDNGLDSGAAYLFAESEGSWDQVAKLTASDGQSDDSFGRAVALDGTLAVVTIPGTSMFGRAYGAAYVFEPVDGAWTQVERITPFDARPLAEFGYSVDVNGQVVAVGAPFRNTSAETPGVVYLFERGAGGFTEASKVHAAGAAPGDSFGESVALSGDYLLVRSRGNPSNDAVHVFKRHDGSWLEVTKLEPQAEYASSGFGGSIAIDGTRVAISAPFGSAAEAVFVYQR